MRPAIFADLEKKLSMRCFFMIFVLKVYLNTLYSIRYFPFNYKKILLFIKPYVLCRIKRGFACIRIAEQYWSLRERNPKQPETATALCASNDITRDGQVGLQPPRNNQTIEHPLMVQSKPPVLQCY